MTSPIALRPVATWTDAMVCVADGHLVTGADVVRLPGLIVGDPPIYRRAVYEARRMRELTSSAMMLARRLEDGSGDMWARLTVEFRLELEDATRDQRPVADRWRRFAQVLGMDADYAAGLDRLGLLPGESNEEVARHGPAAGGSDA